MSILTDQGIIASRISDSIAVKQAVLENDELLGQVRDAAELMIEAFRDGHKLIFCGNGGSAADATHLAAEFVGRFRFNRAPLPALSLSDNASSLSAIGNDYSYAETFSRQVRAFGEAGDVLIALSTSGLSANVVHALRSASERGVTSIAFTGQDGGDCLGTAEICLRMPTCDTARVQECYMVLAHTMCELVERALFAS